MYKINIDCCRFNRIFNPSIDRKFSLNLATRMYPWFTDYKMYKLNMIGVVFKALSGVKFIETLDSSLIDLTCTCRLSQ